MSLTIRPITADDAEDCARITYEAFGRLHDHHRFPRDFPTAETAQQLTGLFIAHPDIWGVVAEREGRILGCNFLDERGPIRGVGPIAVDPESQGQGVGRRLMEAVLQRAEGSQGIRLLQDAFNAQSLSLYSSLGFHVQEPVAVMSGVPRTTDASSVQVRPMTNDDLGACEDLCRRVHGFDRTNELRDALRLPGFSPVVAEREGRIAAWATTLAFFPAACAVAETEDDMRGLILGALRGAQMPASFLLPTRQSALFRWCLQEGLRPIKPMTYMSIGEYHTPNGCWIPSVLY